MRAALPLFLAALLVAGCDSSDDQLDADFYLGTWTLVSVSDEGGDRTAEVLALLDDFGASFRSDGSFRLDVDLNDQVNAAGQADAEIEGNYQATEDALVLLVETLALSFDAEADGSDRVDLTAPGLVISQILGAGLQIEFDGRVTLGIRRQ